MASGFIFDLDGTLVDSIPGITLGINSALSKLGYPELSESQVRSIVGKGSRQLCFSSLCFFEKSPSDELLELMEKTYNKTYSYSWQNHTVPFPGIIDMLKELSDDGAKLAILSNKPHVFTNGIANELFSEIPISPIWGPQPKRERKPHPNSLLEIADIWGLPISEIIMIGDSAIDAKSAQNAHTKGILVDWGYPAGANLADFGFPVISSVKVLKKFLLNELTKEKIPQT